MHISISYVELGYWVCVRSGEVYNAASTLGLTQSAGQLGFPSFRAPRLWQAGFCAFDTRKTLCLVTHVLPR